MSSKLPPVISPPSNKRSTALALPSLNMLSNMKPKRKKQKLGAPKNLWSPKEDKILETEVSKLGEKAWSEIAAKLPGRVGKQCRDRWRNHLCPEVKKGSWTEKEDQLLFEYREKLGNQWAEIAKHIPGRTDLSVKNRFYSYRRKLQRQKKRQEKVKSHLTVETEATREESFPSRTLNFNKRKSVLLSGTTNDTTNSFIQSSDSSGDAYTMHTPPSGMGKTNMSQLSPNIGSNGVPLFMNESLMSSINLQLALYQLQLKNGSAAMLANGKKAGDIASTTPFATGLNQSAQQRLNVLQLASNMNLSDGNWNTNNRTNMPKPCPESNSCPSPLLLAAEQQQKLVDMYNRSAACHPALSQIKQNLN